MSNLIKPYFSLVIISLSLLVSGCASVQPAKPAPTPAVVQEALTVDAIRTDTTDARVAQLWSAAEQSRLEENYDSALEHLLGALEISPRNGVIWSRAAEVQLDKQQAALAESYAVKSNAYAGDNRALLHRNWLIIEHARSIRGDLLGVRSAHKKVQELKYR